MTVPTYVTAAEVKAVMPDTSFGTSRDALLGTLATSASRALDRMTKRDPGAFATGTSGTARYYDGTGSGCLWVDEMAGLPSKVEVDEAGDGNYITWASSDYVVWPYNRTPYLLLEIDVLKGTKVLWYKYLKSVRITAPWGFSISTPDDLKQALITQVVRWFKRGQQGFQDVGAITELNQMKYVQKLDPDIEGLVYDGGYMQMTI